MNKHYSHDSDDDEPLRKADKIWLSVFSVIVFSIWGYAIFVVFA